MTYERTTAASVSDVLRLAEEILCERIPIKKTASDRHSVRFEGGDGAAVVQAHRHGLETVVHVATDQLRTSRLDTEIQYFLTLLPYQPGDVKGKGSALPGGLSRGVA
jgi:hypothetical protein